MGYQEVPRTISSPDIGQEKRPESLIHVSNDMAFLIRVWDVVEGENRDIIDFDLIPTPEAFKNFMDAVKESLINVPTRPEREHKLSQFQKLQSRLATVSVSTQSERLQLEFLEAKTQAHIAYLERKLGRLNEPLEYIERTMGVEPIIIPDDELLAQREIAAQIFKAIGGEYTRENIDAFRARTRVEEKAIIPTIKENLRIFLQDLAEFMQIDKKNISPKFEAESVFKPKEYWMFWVDGSWRLFRLQVNKSTRHLPRFSEGKIKAMVAHEIAAHLAQMTSWLNAIKRDELTPVLGLTSVHDPEQVTSEGIAQTLPYFIPEMRSHLSVDGEFELEHEGLRQMAYNNVHIWANTEHPGEDALIEYVQKFCPSETLEEIRQQIHERTKNTLKQAYLYSYGIGFYRHRNYAMQLNTKEKRALSRKTALSYLSGTIKGYDDILANLTIK